MKNKLKLLLLPCLLFAVILIMASCGEKSPFKQYNKDGYTVSVKYDANGGVFTTNTTTIIDSYNISKFTTNNEGNKEIKLFAPDDEAMRGNQHYDAEKEGYYLAGWYAERNEVKDAEGNVTGYTYAKPWDFINDKLAVAANGQYSSDKPVITLYAAWIPAFTYEYHLYGEDGNPLNVFTTEVIDEKGEKVQVPTNIYTVSVNPLSPSTITLPSDDPVSGKVNAPNSFPAISGKTYNKIYLDAGKTNEVSGATLNHPGIFHKDTATLENETLQLHCTVTNGVQYKITTADQLIKNPDLAGIYTLENDLDFTKKSWPMLFQGNEFTGSFNGNGHTISNVTITQYNNANTVFGLFGTISQNATLTNVTFDHISVTIKEYSRGTPSYGILAGEIVEGATVSGVTLQNSTMFILKNVKLASAVEIGPKFGLAVASGSVNGITFSPENVKAELTEDEYDKKEYSFKPDENGQFVLAVTTE